MKRTYKILGMFLIILCSMCIFKAVDATTITAPGSVEKGQSVTITVTVPNVNTVDLTATVSGAGASGTIRLVDADMSGNARNFSKSITVTPTSAGTITVSVASSSNAVLNGEYVNVAASKTITVTEPAPVVPNPGVNNPPANQGTNTNKPTTDATANKKEEVKKSSDATLASLVVEGYALDFNKDTFKYTINVDKTVTSLKIDAKAADAKASVKVTGNENFAIGENVVKITVTAEDGTVKTYEIVVVKSKFGKGPLSSLKVKGYKFKEEFDPSVLEYNLEVSNIKKLDIKYILEEEESTVSIEGNKNLKIGKNVIKIIVTEKDGTVTTYKINVNVLESSEDVVKDINNTWLTIIIILVVIIIGLVAYIVILKKKEGK